jgi:hypothetical protein
MECLSHNEIKKIVSTVRFFSLNERSSFFSDEKKVDDILDTINNFKRALYDKTEKINEINERIEKMKWYYELDEEFMIMTKNVISAAKDLHSPLIVQYLLFNSITKYGIAANEILAFKNSIDKLKKSFQDLKSVNFYHPAIPRMNEKQLSLS